MNAPPSVSNLQLPNLSTGRMEFLGALACGSIFTFVLFTGMAGLELGTTGPDRTEIAEAEMVSVMLPPPPPPKEEELPDQPLIELLVPHGIAAATTDSPVQIAAMPLPPDLQYEVPVAPPAMIKVDPVAFAPKMQTKRDEVDPNRIYNRNEVDQPPQVRNRVIPYIPSYVMGDQDTFRLLAFLVIDRNGDVVEAKLLKPSENKAVDRTTLDALMKWEFYPAMKKGKRVKCRTQFPVVINRGRSSPFEP